MKFKVALGIASLRRMNGLVKPEKLAFRGCLEDLLCRSMRSEIMEERR